MRITATLIVVVFLNAASVLISATRSSPTNPCYGSCCALVTIYSTEQQKIVSVKVNMCRSVVPECWVHCTHNCIALDGEISTECPDESSSHGPCPPYRIITGTMCQKWQFASSETTCESVTFTSCMETFNYGSAAMATAFAACYTYSMSECASYPSDPTCQPAFGSGYMR